ncbi:antibiotic biosynthesis monooxygenase family protein [Haladaptatus halobius]|uniref:antibiotic biosynthesis monooxygenase family protein n=1 Tax=Haladaptatus halobius TaxID=2884875 RepID=UPI001D0ABF75|nr:antibiotic biosynthesis monooxygenase [Haladaptatus halobius]
MFVVANRIPVTEGHEEEFIELFEERTNRLSRRAGFEKVELLEPIDADYYIIHAYWESSDAFEQWRESEAFQEAHSDLPSEIFAGSNHIESYERAETVKNEN